MRAITLFAMFLVTVAGCTNAEPTLPTEKKPLGAHRIPSRSSAPAQPIPPAQP